MKSLAKWRAFITISLSVVAFAAYVFHKMQPLILFIRKQDPAIKFSGEVLLYQGLWARFWHYPAHYFYSVGHFFVARIISQCARFLTGIEIHPGATLSDTVFIDHGAGTVIGETAIIGDYTTIYQGVTLGGTGKESGKRHPTVGNHVMIGSGAMILGNVTINDRAKIGALSVVLEDVEADATVVGIKGRLENLLKHGWN